MKNKFSLSMWVMASLLLIFVASCQKENYDTSDTTVGEFEPEANYTGDDNRFSFSLTKWDFITFSTSGGTSYTNNITKEVLTNGEFKWTLLSTVTDGITVTNEITFITPTLDAGSYLMEEIHYKKTDDAGVIIDEYTWGPADFQNREIRVSGLEDSPGIVSGDSDDVTVVITPDSLEYFYGFSFSEVPIN